jgi:hypothetical protein
MVLRWGRGDGTGQQKYGRLEIDEVDGVIATRLGTLSTPFLLALAHTVQYNGISGKVSTYLDFSVINACSGSEKGI